MLPVGRLWSDHDSIFAQYWTVLEPKHIEEAQTYCSETFEKSVLVAGKNIEELKYLGRVASSDEMGDMILLGFKRIGTGPFFMSVDGRNVFTGTWAFGEPRLGNGSDTMHTCFNKANPGGRSACDNERLAPFVCAKYRKLEILHGRPKSQSEHCTH